jgi:hypothetical protein
MSKLVLTPVANPIRVAHWGPMLLGIVCLGIGLWFAIGAFVDIDFISITGRQKSNVRLAARRLHSPL